MPDEIPNVAAPAAAPNATPATTPKPGEAPAGAKPLPVADPAKPGAPAERPPPKSDAWAALGAKERLLKSQEATLKDRETALATREAALAEGGTKAERERIKKLFDEGRFDDLEKEFGLSYSAYTKKKLSNGKTAEKPAAGAQALTPDVVAKMVADGIKADREEREKSQTKQSEEAAVEHWKRTMVTIGEKAKGGGDKLAILASELAEEPERIEKALRDIAAMQPTIHVDDALDKLESYFLNRTANLVRSSPKLQALLGLSSANPATGAQPKNEEQNRPRERTGQESSGDGPRTITNVLAAEGASGAQPATRPLSKASKVMAEREAREADIRRIAAKLSG